MMRKLPLIIILLLTASYYSYTRMVPKVSDIVSRSATTPETGAIKEEPLPDANYQIPHGSHSPYEQPIEQPLKAIYDPSIAIPPMDEVDEEIKAREARRENYEKTMADRKEMMAQRRAGDFEELKDDDKKTIPDAREDENPIMLRR